MAVILKGATPPLQEVSKLGGMASRVYGILWESAVVDVRYDNRLHLPWEQRRDCGGTTEWTVKGLSKHMGSCHKDVSKAIAKLMDHGFISVVGYAPSKAGSKHTIFRVTHPDELENTRRVIDIMGEPSERWKRQIKSKKMVYEGEIWDLTNDPVHWGNFDPNYCGLYELSGDDFATEVNTRLAKFKAQKACKY